MSHTVLVVLATIAIVVYVIGRQLLGEPQRGKRLILLPLVLTIVGAVDLGRGGRHPQTVDIVLIVLSAAVAAGIGFRQGAMMRLEHRGGGLWGQMPVKSLWLWGALVASRVIISVVASASGAHVAASTAPILLVLGVNRLAQAASIAPRAIKAGIPFAPEKDGSTFLSRLGTVAPPSSTAPSPRDDIAVDVAVDVAHKPSEATVQAQPATWQTTGRQVGAAVGAALQDRASQRRQGGRHDRRATRGRRAR